MLHCTVVRYSSSKAHCWDEKLRDVCPETRNEELFLGEGEQAWLEEKRILQWRPGMPAPSDLRPAASSQPPKIDRWVRPPGMMGSARVLEAGFLRSHGHNADTIPYYVKVRIDPITNPPYFLLPVLTSCLAQATAKATALAFIVLLPTLAPVFNGAARTRGPLPAIGY